MNEDILGTTGVGSGVKDLWLSTGTFRSSNDRVRLGWLRTLPPDCHHCSQDGRSQEQSDQTECFQTAEDAQENPEERQAGGRTDQRGANKMVSKEDDSRREQEKYNPSTDTGLGDERKAGDHIYDRRAEWNCREQAGRKPE